MNLDLGTPYNNVIERRKHTVVPATREIALLRLPVHCQGEECVIYNSREDKVRMQNTYKQIGIVIKNVSYILG